MFPLHPTFAFLHPSYFIILFFKTFTNFPGFNYSSRIICVSIIFYVSWIEDIFFSLHCQIMTTRSSINTLSPKNDDCRNIGEVDDCINSAISHQFFDALIMSTVNFLVPLNHNHLHLIPFVCVFFRIFVDFLNLYGFF